MICPYCKREIEPVEEFNSTVTVVKDKDGNMKTWTEETRDIDGILISKRVDEYSYYTKTGDINTINQKVYDGEDSLLSEKDIIHYEDTRQPMVVEAQDIMIEGK